MVASATPTTTADPDATDCGGHGTNVASIAAGLEHAAGQDAEGYRHGLGVAPYAQACVEGFRCNGAAASVNYGPHGSRAWAGARAHLEQLVGDLELRRLPRLAQADALVRDASPDAGNQEMVEVFSANDGDGKQPARPGRRGLRQHHRAGHRQERDHGGRRRERARLGHGTGGHRTAAPTAPPTSSTSRAAAHPGRRMKPDLVAPGTSPAPRRSTGYTGGSVCDKTSAAAASTARVGHLAGHPARGRRRRAAARLVRAGRGPAGTPSPALTKAILVNTAVDIAGGDSGGKQLDSRRAEHRRGLGPREHRAALDGTQREYLDESAATTLDANGRASCALRGERPAKPVRVTLA